MTKVYVENFKLVKENNYLEFVAEFEIDKDYYNQKGFKGNEHVLCIYNLGQYAYLKISKRLFKEVKDNVIKHRVVVDECIIGDKNQITKRLI